MKAFPATMALEDTLHYLNQAPTSGSRKRRRVQYAAVPNKKLQLALLESSLKVLDLDLELDFPAIEWNFSSDEEPSSGSRNESITPWNEEPRKSDITLREMEKKEQQIRKRAQSRSFGSLASKHDTLVRCRSFLDHLSTIESSAGGLIRTESLPPVPPLSERSS